MLTLAADAVWSLSEISLIQTISAILRQGVTSARGTACRRIVRPCLLSGIEQGGWLEKTDSVRSQDIGGQVKMASGPQFILRSIRPWQQVRVTTLL